MVNRVTRSEKPIFKVTVISPLRLLVGYLLFTSWLLVTIKQS